MGRGVGETDREQVAHGDLLPLCGAVKLPEEDGGLILHHQKEALRGDAHYPALVDLAAVGMKEEAVIDQLLGPPAGGRQAAVFLKPAEDHPEARLQVPDGHGLIQPVT